MSISTMTFSVQPAARDYAQFEDDLLVVFAQKVGDREAMRELIRRHHEWVRRFIARLARRAHLPADERPDAEQNAILVIARAIATFDVLQVDKRPRCTFRSFLQRVLRARFYNDVRKVRRRRCREGGSVDADSVLDEVAEAPLEKPGACPWSAGEAHDPAVAAEQHEWRQRFEQVLGSLEPRLRQVWDALAVGKTLEVIAIELDVSLKTVKRCRAELQTLLIATMRE
jgi:RNA polymerase sigma factor (sigma-70 family)